MRTTIALFLMVAGCGGDTNSLISLDAGGADLSHPGMATGDMGGNTADMAGPSPSPTGTCGTCPSGSSCGVANGVNVCKTASGIPLFSNVFVIVMENTSLSSLQGNMTTPYLHGLLMNSAYASDYHGVTHPSLPNYIALTSGAPGVQMDGTTALSCDCDPVGATCNMCSSISTLLSPCNCAQTAMHIGDQLDTAGKTWKNYGEGMGSACNSTSAGPYATRHVPFLYFQNVQTNATRCSSHIVDYTGFAADLASPPSLSFIAPNLDNDMHGTGLLQGGADITAGDTWLSTNAQAIVNSAAFKKGGVLFIVWDEDDLSGTLAKDDAIPLFVLSPYAKGGGYASPTHADHYSLLATMEDGLGVPRLGGAAGATPLSDFFKP